MSKKIDKTKTVRAYAIMDREGINWNWIMPRRADFNSAWYALESEGGQDAKLVPISITFKKPKFSRPLSDKGERS